MKRAIITISEGGRVNIPSGDVWMSEMELVELFVVIAPTLRATIRAIYKSGVISESRNIARSYHILIELLSTI